jgi:hypothetical protein
VQAVSSMWVGSSPEFEMALYTLCFAAGQEENMVQIGPYDVKIRCYRIRSKYGDKVGSTFPEVCSSLCAAQHFFWREKGRERERERERERRGKRKREARG